MTAPLTILQKETDDTSPPFTRFLDVLLPDGGYVLVEAKSYFDESGSHRGSPVLCVAGYIIEKKLAIKLTDAWRAVLKEHGLPFFRIMLIRFRHTETRD